MKQLSSLIMGITFFFLGLDILETLQIFSLPSGLSKEKGSGVSTPLWLLRVFGLLGRNFYSLKNTVKSMFNMEKSDTLWDEIAFSLAFHMKAGATVIGAIRAVSEEGNTHGHKALKRVFQLYQAGSSLMPAIVIVSREFPALEKIGAILEMGLTTGGNVPALLYHASEVLRRRRLFEGEVRAKLVEAKMTAILLAVLPWVMAFAMLRFDKSTIYQLISTEAGRNLALLSVGLWALGIGLVAVLIGSLAPKEG